jgi:hypothetical protein
MSKRAKVHLADCEYTALSCAYSLHKDNDENGYATAALHDGIIEIEIESDDRPNIAARLMERFEPVLGSITFYKNNAPLKILSWQNGYITKFTETFNMLGNSPMIIRLVISAEKLMLTKPSI